ncbi:MULTISPECIES: uroporphyrinogen-III C-methyltransferase [Flavobacterium]|jgi:uroporphyrin-III C-methyltransferase|uniref:uroporphyrinogen-III C-methyltransferase n=1 Tax=Flavobacterium cupriresistens TaxID=2893885 RepID=A0ABU4RDX9_9FLAO|nr:MULTISPECIES: uroporphyrinogen-III C-methyltransferase [unclassified Flavobacterium]KLT71578.1 uroporphyrin-III methyltransferase [Flavobacterium sp. ABG]MDX6190793.1 uroporphyrinogen-III C-methyltransferase [Flavobacterium sp. Fl-318]UFH44034.1 uroporphyrinogen-III C-methyltransferase [Flavobacterium sp. F-323]
MLNTIKPKVTLVGAGPGDPDLLTLKAVKALAEANVVLYDALANEEILSHASKDAITIFVGKKMGNHAYTQDQINQLIVDNALTYGNVVRLKGGDPFVFGRGSEEIEFVESFGIPTFVVPGISSVVAVPASQGISITKRGVSESFWAITGTTSDRKLSSDVALAAQSSATVVILMGMHKLSQIIHLFQKEDKGNLPVAIIQNGTTADEKVGVGTVDSILNIVKEKGLSSPAIIVLGEVVRESNKLKGCYEEFLSKEIIM